uniref:leukemia inhibitory factor receptor-like n=1 Tax=Centroberyx gerrardi TaxID=166262 RepID=UPI003AAB80A7
MMFTWVFLVSLFCMGTQDRSDPDDGVIQCGPQNMTETHNFTDQRIFLTWEDDPSCSAIQEELIYEVEVLRAGKRVHDDEVVVTADHIGTTHSWNWTSPLALECASHSIRLSSRYKNHTSPWSQEQTIPGTSPSDLPKIFPQDRVVEVGSRVSFCCVLEPGGRFDKMFIKGYNSTDMNTTKISNQTYVLTVDLNTPPPYICIDVICNTYDSGACVYVGYPPADWGLQCETRDLQSVECHWNIGRETHLTGPRATAYRLLGRLCSDEETKRRSCKQKVQVNVGERNWTLKAQNVLGSHELTDRADLSERVHMFAPKKLTASTVNSRNVSLEWSWTIQEYNQLHIVCQIRLRHGGQTHIINDSGVGLNVTVLRGLMPSQMYAVQVRCGTEHHFWKWSDWSTSTFRTKDDLPDSLDVWIQTEHNQTIIIWKKLLPNQSHGDITDYEVTWRKATERERQNKTIFPPEHSVALSLDTSEEHIVTVTARNVIGSSSPAAITISTLHPGREVESAHISGSDGGFNVSWSVNPAASCGYVVDWCPTFSICRVEWLKVPPGVTNARILSEHFTDGVRYSLSIYACTQGAPELLERREGYVRETKLPDNQIQLKWEQLGSDVQVSWTAIAPRNQSAFIQGYIMYYTDNSTPRSNLNRSPEATSLTVKNLPISSYKFTVKALTSAGECGDTSFSLSMNSLTDKMIMAVIISLVSVFSLLSLVTILCYRHWTCVKLKIYPPIPKPVLTDNWLTSLGEHGRHWLHVDSCHHSETDIVDVPQLYCKRPPGNGDISQEERHFVSAQTQSPKGYYNQPLRSRAPAALTLNTKNISSPSGLPSVPHRSVFVNPSMDSVSPSSPELQDGKNLDGYQPQSPVETCGQTQTEENPESPLSCVSTYILIPHSSSK